MKRRTDITLSPAPTLFTSRSEVGMRAARTALTKDPRYPSRLSIADCVELVVAAYLDGAQTRNSAAEIADRYAPRVGGIGLMMTTPVLAEREPDYSSFGRSSVVTPVAIRPIGAAKAPAKRKPKPAKKRGRK